MAFGKNHAELVGRLGADVTVSRNFAYLSAL